MPRILFAHKNFPAQFGALGEWLAGQGWEVAFLTQREGARHPAMRVVRCADHRAAAEATHRYLRRFEASVITGQAFARAAVGLRHRLRPDIVMAHAGWGAGTFLKDVWPQACAIPYFEWYYNWPFVDRTPYDTAAADPLDARARNRVRNAPLWADFCTADRALCPTRFQAAQFPDWLRERLTVMHDGVDTELHSPRRGPGDPRPLGGAGGRRGPHLDHPRHGAAPRLPRDHAGAGAPAARRPRLHALIGGEDRVAYGAALPEGDSWKRRMLAELDLDLAASTSPGCSAGRTWSR